MPKVINEGTRFSGDVILPDALNFRQFTAFASAQKEAAALLPEEGETFDLVAIGKYNQALLPGVLACVTEWHINGIDLHPTIETFPATPVVAVGALLNRVVSAIREMFDESEAVPN